MSNTDKKFQEIYSTYIKRRNALLIKRESQHLTSAGYWAASDPKVLLDLFRKVNLSKFKHFLDLGSGDGVVVAVASLFTESAGIEIDKSLHDDAMQIRTRLKLDYVLQNIDYLEADFSAYDVIFINPDNHFHKLEKKLVEEFKGTLVVADNIFKPLLLVPDSTVSVKDTLFNIFRIK
jgi:protein-L-isoaspartate O-methyltransferase